MMANYDEELTSSVGTMLADIKDACDGFRFEDEDYLNPVPIDPGEARELIVDTAKELCRCVCRYAAYNQAYEESLRACGIDLRKLRELTGFSNLSCKIMETMESEVMSVIATPVTA